jgi:hypothetical protein
LIGRDSIHDTLSSFHLPENKSKTCRHLTPNSMVQGPSWRLDTCLSGQEIPSFYGNHPLSCSPTGHLESVKYITLLHHISPNSILNYDYTSSLCNFFYPPLTSSFDKVLYPYKTMCEHLCFQSQTFSHMWFQTPNSTLGSLCLFMLWYWMWYKLCVWYQLQKVAVLPCNSRLGLQKAYAWWVPYMH